MALDNMATLIQEAERHLAEAAGGGLVMQPPTGQFIERVQAAIARCPVSSHYLPRLTKIKNQLLALRYQDPSGRAPSSNV